MGRVFRESSYTSNPCVETKTWGALVLFIAILVSDAVIKGAGGIATISAIMEEAEYSRLMDLVMEARTNPKALAPMFRTADLLVDPKLIVATFIVDEAGQEEGDGETVFNLDTSDIEDKDDDDFEN